ncbi:hypothetical protein F4861DRAFT_541328 [Xylaria intraflava]|nr:hypothetical protein F4861DRAFT_541328 [Xylaria intraflava]
MQFCGRRREIGAGRLDAFKKCLVHGQDGRKPSSTCSSKSREKVRRKHDEPQDLLVHLLDQGSAARSRARAVYVDTVKDEHLTGDYGLDNPPSHHDLVTLHEEIVIKNILRAEADFIHLAHLDSETVLENIPFYPFIHFACHGPSAGFYPSQSGLLLVEDGKTTILTIADLEKVGTKSGVVAYLSACSTAEIQAASKLADETIHFANTFHAPGFQHVIRTMWGCGRRNCERLL